MWIYGTDYTVHIVKYNPELASPGMRDAHWELHGHAQGGRGVFLVRAFTERDVRTFAEHPSSSGVTRDAVIYKEENADYQYRTLIAENFLASIITGLACNIRYDTLKASVLEREGYGEHYRMLEKVHAATKAAMDERFKAPE